jgi:hypothetical protein
VRRACYDSEDAGAYSVEQWRENLQEQGVRCGEVWLALLAHVKVDMELRVWSCHVPALQWMECLASRLHR